ncbi:hypothetical protein GCM10007231_13560 [Nocardioides daphniae]|uniref:Uncharacterized protein n=2 Tax=Nocardioides daphniae TaxID=402297 RepID=A0ABQ1Q7K9_9ACTN|nr:hypothetical protein [Nocardioides daphniae]GGD15816.1 hypothetical protein GCM10007231_13560 [Nocardioides daphniae]
MFTLRKTTATLGATALLATGLGAVATAPAQAADREFRCSGAEVEFDVEKEDGRFEVEADIDDAKPGSKWRITLRHDGKVYYNKVRTADSDGDVEVDRNRRNTAGKDVFKITVKKVGSKKSCSRTITRR